MSDERQRPRYRGLIANAMAAPQPKVSTVPLDFIDPDTKEPVSLDDLWQQIVGEIESLTPHCMSKEANIWHGNAEVLHEALRSAVESAKSSDSESNLRDALLLGYALGQLENLDYSKLSPEGSRMAAAELNRRTKGLNALKPVRQEAYGLMRETAQYFWETPPTSRLRLGQMAEKVSEEIERIRDEMLAHDPADASRHWPGSLQTITRIIRDLAPEHALKRGRPRKD
ncbi:hypothetical protein [Cobetia amphilecti]|uniref:hypothetical protein n=1 Tax=Cobetia amphilecti TaxID=1055104 RepID=UPI0026E3FBA0|nr:hypothetical protein [Cobetia amphilecti]MDO6815333.1 hypothetical protein [Cobetia amphilecti]